MHLAEELNLEYQKSKIINYFNSLRDRICASYEEIENEYAIKFAKKTPGKFIRNIWDREEGGGGGEYRLMKLGNIFEKVGVNISVVHGKFSEKFAKEIPCDPSNPEFFACGISLVSHPLSPFIPAFHMNLRFIATKYWWFGGGADITPAFVDVDEVAKFHNALKEACDKSDLNYYPKFKERCDEYFYLPHRGEARGQGGIFFDYLSDEFDANFKLVKDLGEKFYDIYPQLIRDKYGLEWTESDKKVQLARRSLYAEFNLLYDRGVRFGLMTNGKIDAIFMSMPPSEEWL